MWWCSIGGSEAIQSSGHSVGHGIGVQTELGFSRGLNIDYPLESYSLSFGEPLFSQEKGGDAMSFIRCFWELIGHSWAQGRLASPTPACLP